MNQIMKYLALGALAVGVGTGCGKGTKFEFDSVNYNGVDYDAVFNLRTNVDGCLYDLGIGNLDKESGWNDFIYGRDINFDCEFSGDEIKLTGNDSNLEKLARPEIFNRTAREIARKD
jgi:hypothetical protein